VSHTPNPRSVVLHSTNFTRLQVATFDCLSVTLNPHNNSTAAANKPPMDSPVGESLHKAAEEGTTQTIVLRLGEGAAINALDARGRIPPHLAIEHGHVEAAKLLLDRGSDIEAPIGPLFVRPLHSAVMTLSPAMTATVLRYRPNLESRVNGLTHCFTLSRPAPRK
jgi:ankyrin repeat protein